MWHGQGPKINIIDSVKNINNYGQVPKLWQGEEHKPHIVDSIKNIKYYAQGQ